MDQLVKNPEYLLWAVPLLPLLGFIINGAFGRRFTVQASGGIASAAVVGSFIIATALFIGPLQNANSSGIQSVGFTWFSVGGFHIDGALLLDRLSGLYMMVITGVASLIHIYSVGYMSHDKSHSRYFAYLNLFVFSMLMLVLGNSLITLFLGWEGVGLCSYLLIGFWYDSNENCNAGKKAFIANRIGDFGFMIGMFLLFWHFGTLEYAGAGGLAGAMHTAEIAGNVDTSILNWACLCLFIGATGKSAQIPLYVWLPDAMAGPTPVSALIHAATMVTAGIYMVARLNFIFIHAETVMTLIAVIGGATALFAGLIALVQHDIKKVLAYSTVSQLGFMFMALGLGAFPVAVFHVFTHAFFKALLFLGSGSVIHSLEHTLGHGNPDSQDMRKMGGLKKKMPITMFTMTIGALALAGIPLFSGFFSKDMILYTAFHRGDSLGWVIYGLGVAAAICTGFYSFRLIALTFFGKWRGEEKVYAHADESPRSMTLPLLVLSVAAVGAGFLWLPAAFGLHFEPFKEWLHPIWAQGQAALATTGSHLMMPTHHDEAAIQAEWINMGISSAIAIAVALGAFLIYSKADKVEKLAASVQTEDGYKSWYRVMLNKFYVDEFYDAVIINPLRVASDVIFLIVDVVIIDILFVRGSSELVRASSDMARRLQTGVIRHYLYAFAVGTVILMGVFLLIVQR